MVCAACLFNCPTSMSPGWHDVVCGSMQHDPYVHVTSPKLPVRPLAATMIPGEWAAQHQRLM
eukprot:3912275-Prorocentrum_lima.AAC.1